MKLLLILLIPFWALAVSYRQPREPIAPYLSGDTFRVFSDFAFDEITPPFNPGLVKRGDTVFVNGDFLASFFTKVHPRIQNPYVLISHNSDASIPGVYRAYLDDEKILAWFGQNIDGTLHSKLHPLPIGLENHNWKPQNVEVIERVNGKKLPKRYLLYYNLSHTSYLPERPYVRDLFAHVPYCHHSERKGYEPFIEDLAASKFVISPRGNGLDTHRIWESLYVGAFPIVKSSSLDSLYAGLPVVIVNDWREVTEEFLNQKYEELSEMQWSLDKLYTHFWFGWINECRLSAKCDSAPLR